MFMVVTMESATFMGKNFQDNHQNNCEDYRSHIEANVRHIFEIGVRTRGDLRFGDDWLGESFMEIHVVIGDERIINLQRRNIYDFQDYVVCLGKIHQSPESTEAWRKRIEWITSSQSYRDHD